LAPDHTKECQRDRQQRDQRLDMAAELEPEDDADADQPIARPRRIEATDPAEFAARLLRRGEVGMGQPQFYRDALRSVTERCADRAFDVLGGGPALGHGDLDLDRAGVRKCPAQQPGRVKHTGNEAQQQKQVVSPRSAP
jgi:hypothetical protein